jgi:2-dehydropantoate 2-reductase
MTSLTSMSRDISAKICVAGAGAIGLTIASRLALAGHNVTLIARGDSLGAINRDGIRLIDQHGDHRVKVTAIRACDAERQGLIFLCPKSQDLPKLAGDVQPAIGPDTVIIPVVNGIPWWYFETGAGTVERFVSAVDPRGSLKTLLPSSQIVGAVTMITAERIAPGFVRSVNPLRFTIGEIYHRTSQRTDQIARVLSTAGIETVDSPRIRDALWTKVLLNLISNPLSVITGATLRQIFTDDMLAEVSRRMLHEAMAVALSYQATIAHEAEELLALAGSMGDVKTSMLQDYERGVPLELDAICRAVLELADHCLIDMPTTRIVTNIASYRGRTRAAAMLAA